MKKLLAILLVSTLFLAGCQATPENKVIVQKDLEQMLDKATKPQENQGSLGEILDIAPDRYKANFEDQSGNVKVVVDADVVLPDAKSIPIVRVKAKPFNQETVDKLIDILFESGPLYDPESLTELTKTDIVELLTQLKQKKTELEAQGMKREQPSQVIIPEDSGSEGAVEAMSMGNQLDEVIESIKFFEQELETAPDKKSYIEVPRELQTQDISAMPEENRDKYRGKLFQYARVGQENPSGGISSLWAVNNESGNTYFIEYVNRKDYDTNSGMYYTDVQWAASADKADKQEAATLSFPTITENDAKIFADQFLEQIGVDYLDCASVEKVAGYSSAEFLGGIKKGNTIKAYRLQYVRKVNGVPVTYNSAESTWADMSDGAVWTWEYEKMTLIIDDNGIVEMLWNAPYEVTETVTETTKMLTFPEIRDVFEKMIIINNAFSSDYSAVFNITDIRLGLARINEQNHLDSGLLIPVWNFFGTATYHYNNSEQEEVNTENEPGLSYLTVNAIDGSVIDIDKGY